MALATSVRLFALALAATRCAAAVESSHATTVAIGAHGEVHPPEAPGGSRRLMRSDSQEAALAEDTSPEIPAEETQKYRAQKYRAHEDISSEIPVGSVLDRTIRTFHGNKNPVFPSSLLASEGPGKMEVTPDSWSASVSAMQKFSKEVSIDCSIKYGDQMLLNLMNERSVHHLCSGPSSSVVCHEREPFDIPRFMCELNHVKISAEGTSASGCKDANNFDIFEKTQGVTENNIFGSNTKFKGLNMVTGKLDCPTNGSSRAIVQVPTDTQNFYEWYGDWVTLWETLAAMKWNPKDVDVYLVGKIAGDGKPFQRPFDEAWSRAFKAGSVHVGSYQDLFGKGICFPQIVTAPQGALSSMTFRGGRGGVIGCAAPTLMASAMFLQALFPLPPPATPTSAKTLTLILRKGLRRFESDDYAIRTVKSVLPKDWTLRLYRPENMTNLADQLNVAATTQVFVGVHGAGMMHVLFLPPQARVVEIFCEDRPRENHHFQNLESMAEPSAHPHLFSYYFGVSSARCTIDKKAVANAIKAYDSPAPKKEMD